MRVLAVLALVCSPTMVSGQDPFERMAIAMESANRDRVVADVVKGPATGVPPEVQFQVAQIVNNAQMTVAQANAQVLQLKNANLVLIAKVKALEKSRGTKGKDAAGKDRLWEIAREAIEGMKNPADVEKVLNQWLEVVCKPAGIKAVASVIK